jgi:phosphoglycolate phosphatase-like HAD superfamily hydrolase
MKKKVIFLDGDGTLWYPKKTKRTEKPHWIYEHPETKDNYLEHLELAPKIKETLEFLKSKNILLVVISANPRGEEVAVNQIKDRLNYFDLAKYFDNVRSSRGDDSKDKARVFLEELEKFNLQKEDALMIGDSYKYDYLSMQEIGVDAFWIKNSLNKMSDEEMLNVKSIDEVSDVLDMLDLKNFWNQVN